MNTEISIFDQTDGETSTDIVISQKCESGHYPNTTMAWHVIERSQRGQQHKVQLPDDYEIAICAESGIELARQAATPGQVWDIRAGTNGPVFTKSATAPQDHLQTILISQLVDPVVVKIYKLSKLMVEVREFVADNDLIIEFHPLIYLSAMQPIEQGDPMSSAILQDVNSAISLIGLSRACLEMLGGGTQDSPVHFVFRR